jgi:hypothetical protein
LDLQSTVESQITALPSYYGVRADNHLVVWQSGGGVYYTFLKEPDLSVTASDIVFSNDSPTEGNTIDVTVTVHNLTTISTTHDITVRVYDGDPDAGATQLGSDGVIAGGIAGRSQGTVTFTGIPVGLGRDT